MRDGNRIREKIELQLDGRQVVLLVLGSAVTLGVVFWLGVGVGKDLATASAPPPASTDPLAKLDLQAEAPPPAVDDKLTFPDTLTSPSPAVNAPEQKPVTPEVKAPPPPPAEEIKAAEAAFTVQAAALPTQAEADALVTSLKNQGYSPYVVVGDVSGKTFYRVRVGQFGTKEEAERYLSDFKRETGRDGFITQLGK